MKRNEERSATRRKLINWGGRALIATSILAAPGLLTVQAAEKKGEDKGKGKPEAEKVLPAEDLMREHGVLSRILLIYDHARPRLAAGEEFPPDVLASAAGIVRKFIEEYHEKNEENYLFPRFKKAGKLTSLVEVLLTQHEAGRKVTALIIENASADALREPAQRRQMARWLEEFTRMYRPHKAREDTVLFPAIRQVVSAKEYDEMGEIFEGAEEKALGEGGFEKVVDQVAQLEAKTGIGDLSQFTPKV